MKGLTSLIIRELEQGIPVKDIVTKYPMTNAPAVYKIAKRYKIAVTPPPHLSEEEKRQHRKKVDEVQYKKKAETKREVIQKLERPDILLPPLPLVAMKSRGLAIYNTAWILRQGTRLEKPLKVKRAKNR